MGRKSQDQGQITIPTSDEVLRIEMLQTRKYDLTRNPACTLLLHIKNNNSLKQELF